MNNFTLRPAAPDDAADLLELWTRAFGDPPDFAAAMLEEAGLLACALCAEAEGQVRSAMFAFEGLSLGGAPAAYLYALATHPDHRGRGMGAAVARALAQRCFDRGAALVCLAPADGGLADWYARTLGTQPLCAFRDEAVPCRPNAAPCRALSAAQYLAARRGEPGLTLQLLTAQSLLHRSFGGGFFRVETAAGAALACAEPTDGGAVLLRELLCPAAARPEACGALARHVSAGRVLLRERSGCGTDLVYITSSSLPLKQPESIVFPYLLE